MGAWINVGVLYAVLVRRGHYAVPARVLARLARQAVAAAIMGTGLTFLREPLAAYYAGGIVERVGALLALGAAGAALYFGVAFLTGAIKRDTIARLTRNPA